MGEDHTCGDLTTCYKKTDETMRKPQNTLESMESSKEFLEESL